MISLLDLVLIFGVSVSIFFDIKERRIPNWISIPGILIGLVLNSFLGLAQLLQSCLGLAAGIGIMIVPFALGWLGAGDVKLFGLVGAVLGIGWIPRVFFYTGLISGALALLTVCTRGLDHGSFRQLWLDLKIAVISVGRVMPNSVSQRGGQKKKSIPWGVAIGLGAIIAFYLDSDGRWAGF
jgi:prepilin peptidase CpaA